MSAPVNGSFTTALSIWYQSELYLHYLVRQCYEHRCESSCANNSIECRVMKVARRSTARSAWRFPWSPDVYNKVHGFKLKLRLRLLALNGSVPGILTPFNNIGSAR